jgi:hypothetical protein
MEGMQSMVNDHSMRQELVGGGLGEHFTRGMKDRSYTIILTS